MLFGHSWNIFAEAYSELSLSNISKMEFLLKIVRVLDLLKPVNYFGERLHVRCLTEFSVRLWLDGNVCYKIGKCFKLVSRSLLLFNRPLIIKTRKIVAILHSPLAILPTYILIREFRWKNNHRKRNSESRISQNVSGMSLCLG